MKTPRERIEALSTETLSDDGVRSMVNYLLGYLSSAVETGTTPEKIAYAMERAHHFGSLTPNGPIGGRLS
jgi:hypothetical protein